MKNDCHKKTAVELRIQKSMIKTLGHAAAHSTRSASVSISLLGIVTRFYELERQCSKFGTDVDIHLAEIHTIMAIHNNEGIHVGGLAEQLGVSLEIADMSFDAMNAALQAGKIDLAIANFYKQDGVEKICVFSIPYIHNDISVLVRRRQP